MNVRDLTEIHKHKLALEKIYFAIQIEYKSAYTLDCAAKLAGLGRNQFNTLFRKWFGETFHAYLKRLGLEHAARLLRRSSLNMLDIAIAVGYETNQSFSRAFLQHFHCSPTVYRFRHQDCTGLTVSSVTLVRLSSKPILKKRFIGNYANLQGKLVEATEELDAQDHKTWRTAAIYYDDPAISNNPNMRADICIFNPHQDLSNTQFINDITPDGLFAVYIHTGPYSQIHSVFAAIADSWLPKSGYSARAEGPVCMVTYLNDPRLVAPDQLMSEIAIPVTR
jgi:AraC family transcriptional regulator